MNKLKIKLKCYLKNHKIKNEHNRTPGCSLVCRSIEKYQLKAVPTENLNKFFLNVK